MSLATIVKNQVESIVLNSLSEYPTTPVIFSHQSSTEPIKTYCSVNILSFDQIGRTESTTKLDSSSKMQFTAPYEVMIQLSFLGDTASEVAFSSYLRLANAVLNRELSQTYKLSVADKSQLRRIPQLRNTKWVDVLSFDVTFFFIGSFKQTVGVINQVIYEDPITEVEIAIPPTLTP